MYSNPKPPWYISDPNPLILASDSEHETRDPDFRSDSKGTVCELTSLRGRWRLGGQLGRGGGRRLGRRGRLLLGGLLPLRVAAPFVSMATAMPHTSGNPTVQCAEAYALKDIFNFPPLDHSLGL